MPFVWHALPVTNKQCMQLQGLEILRSYDSKEQGKAIVLQ